MADSGTRNLLLFACNRFSYLVHVSAQNNFVCFHFAATFHECCGKLISPTHDARAEHQKRVHDRKITANYLSVVSQSCDKLKSIQSPSETLRPSQNRRNRTAEMWFILCKNTSVKPFINMNENISRLTLLWIKHDDVGRFWHRKQNFFLLFAFRFGSRDFVIGNLLCQMRICGWKHQVVDQQERNGQKFPWDQTVEIIVSKVVKKTFAWSQFTIAKVQKNAKCHYDFLVNCY